MEDAHLSTPISVQNSTNVGTKTQFIPQAYKVRRGAIDFGRDYEIKMTTLAALRCISAELEEAGIAFNADGCSDFDDLIVYKKMKNSDCGLVSLVQLKHQVNPKYIQSEDFLKEKGNFSLRKYANGFDEILKDNFKVLQEMFNDKNISCNNLELVLYTNRDADISGRTSNPCKFLELHQQAHYLKTNENSKIYTIDVCHEQMQGYPKIFLKSLLVFAKQVDINSINQLILVEIKKIVPNVDYNIVDNFVQFVNSWAKGALGGCYILTRTRIIQELTLLLLDLHISKFISLTDDVTVPENDGIFDQLIENFDIIVVSNFDSSAIKYLRRCVNRSFTKRLQFKQNDLRLSFKLSEEQFNQLINRFPGLTYLISKNKLTDGGIGIFDLYKALWKLGYVPLYFVLDNNEEYLELSRILSHLKCNRKFVILTKFFKSKTLLPDSFKVLCKLSDLDDQLLNIILDEEVKFQNRGPFTFRSIIKNVPNVKELITTNDIICVLNGTFCVGDSLPSLPEIYIPRTLPKIVLNFDVFTVEQHIFVVLCDNEMLFRDSVKSNCLLFNSSNEITENDLTSNKCLVILAPHGTDVHSARNLFNRSTHYLKFLDEQGQMFWLKSCGDVNPIRSHANEAAGNTFYFWLEQIAKSSDIVTKFPNRLNIISAGPGMGKTVAMNVVALCAPVDRWVLRIDLNKYVDYFYSVNVSREKSSTYLEHFGKKLLENCDTELNNHIFRYFLDSKNILILLDGFDEIASAYKDTVTQLIHTLQNDEYLLWITTRPVMKSHVELEFNSLSYNLNLFTQQNQIDFLEKYFSMHISQNDLQVANKTNTFIKQLLQLAETNLKTNILILMGIPLQTRMLAEVYLQNCKDYIGTNQVLLSQDLDILYLYDQFVDLKQKEFIAKFRGDEGKRIIKSSDEYHKLCAVKIIFHQQEFTKFWSTINRLKHFTVKLFSPSDYYDIDLEISDKLNRFMADVQDASNNVGFVIPHDQLNLSFVHRTFAEYYAALWLAENVQNLKYKMFLKKIEEPNFELVRNFFDRIIVKDLPLHTAVMNRNIQQVRSVLNSETVHEKDKLSRTPLFLLATWAEKFPINLFNYSIACKNTEQYVLVNPEAEIAKLLINENNVEFNVFDYVNEYYCLNILNEFVKTVQIINIPKYLDAFLYYSIQYNFANLLTIIFNTYPNTRHKINNLIVTIDSDKYNLLQSSILFQRPNITEILLENTDKIRVRSIIEPFNTYAYDKLSVTDTMKNDKIKLIEELLFGGNSINAINKIGNTTFYDAVKNNKYHLINLLLSHGATIKLKRSTVVHYAAENGQNDIIELLFFKGLDLNIIDDYGETPLHRAAASGQNKTIELLLLKGLDINVRNNSGSTILHHAAREGQNDTIELLLRKGLDLNVTDSTGGTLLHRAAANGKNKTIEFLISKGLDINVKNDFDSTLLHHAVKGGQNDTIELLLQKGLDLNITDNAGGTLLHRAAANGQNKTIELLLQKGMDINVRNNFGSTILHHAAKSGQNDTIELLLGKGLDLNATDNDGDTLLHRAASNGQNKTIELLLLKGLDLNVRNNLGNTVSHHAAGGGQNHTLDLLSRKGLDLNARDNDGDTLLHRAAINGQNKTVELLLSQGLDINVRNDSGSTALHHAARGGQDDTIELLLRKGLDLNVVDNTGGTLLHRAAANGRNKTIELLLGKGLDICVRNNFGSTILHHAAKCGQNDTIELLLRKGLDLNATDNDGDTLLHRAASNGQNTTIELLLSKGLDLNVRNNSGSTVLHHAAGDGQDNTLELLGRKGLELNTRDNDGDTLLHRAAINGQNKTVELLLSQGLDINVRNDSGSTVLHHAARGGKDDIIELLLCKGLDLAVTDNSGGTLLHRAAANGRNSTLELLILKGMDINVRNNFGSTILHHAAKGGHNDTIELLLSKGLDLNVIDYDGDTLLHRAAINGQNNTIELLLSKGLDLNVKNNFGSTASHHAAGGGQDDTINLLCYKGLDLNTRDDNGDTLLHRAAINGQNKTVELLLSQGLDISVRNDSGSTALHHAARGGQDDTIELLLRKGLNLTVTDNTGDTLLHRAAANGRNKTIELLLQKGFDMYVRNDFGSTILHHAAKGGYNDTIDLLLSKGLDINVTDSEGDTLLHRAAVNGQNNTIEFLLLRGFDPHVRNSLGKTALNHAVRDGHNVAVQLLTHKSLHINSENY